MCAQSEWLAWRLFALQQLQPWMLVLDSGAIFGEHHLFVFEVFFFAQKVLPKRGANIHHRLGCLVCDCLKKYSNLFFMINHWIPVVMMKSHGNPTTVALIREWIKTMVTILVVPFDFVSFVVDVNIRIASHQVERVWMDWIKIHPWIRKDSEGRGHSTNQRLKVKQKRYERIIQQKFLDVVFL